MTEIERGLSVDLTKVDAIEESNGKVILYIHGEQFTWNVSYGIAISLITAQKRIQAQTP